MKVLSLTVISLIIGLAIAYSFVVRSKSKIKLDLNKQNLLGSMRKISLENQRDCPLNLLFSLNYGGAQPDIQEHVMPAHDAGWIPYCMGGTLKIECNDNFVEFNIDAIKEYKVIVSNDGSIKYSIHDLQD